MRRSFNLRLPADSLFSAIPELYGVSPYLPQIEPWITSRLPGDPADGQLLDWESAWIDLGGEG